MPRPRKAEPAGFQLPPLVEISPGASPAVEVVTTPPKSPTAIRADMHPWDKVLTGVRSGMRLREALALVDLTRGEVRRLLSERSGELAKARAEGVHYALRSMHGIAQGDRGSWQAAAYLIERQGMRDLEAEIEDTVLKCTPAAERGAVLDNARARLRTYFTRPEKR
jgi:hypothetical protein